MEHKQQLSVHFPLLYSAYGEMYALPNAKWAASKMSKHLCISTRSSQSPFRVRLCSHIFLPPLPLVSVLALCIWLAPH
ncbi:hypothetical protein BT63DRAFT_425436 [Microthyrium microscopicum]|uniref:Uncharacterized protein n=1 Tax=Microthyrium microscopicum TaxID=703497 RepID=A0A6A6UB32_9PEZI|nr:hypothetical protein BT63DRAFT_425436 [Microthyrium microscopicum]